MCKNIYSFGTWKKPFARYLTALFHKLPLVFVFYSKKRFNNDIKKIIYPIRNNYNTVIIEDSHMVRFVPEFNLLEKTQIIYIPFDFLYLQFKRIGLSSKSIFSKFYHLLTAKKLLKYEPLFYTYFDKIIFVSNEDRKLYFEKHPNSKVNIEVIPMGINLLNNVEEDNILSTTENSILFIGNMNYEPNRLAVHWFQYNVYEILKERISNIKWYIVGFDADKYFKFDDPSIQVYSSVSSLRPFILNSKIIISPLNVGTGVKNKILDSMALSKVVVGSKLSFDGIDIEDKKHALIAYEPKDYVKYISLLFNNEELRKEIEKNAFEFIKENFSMEKIMEKWRKAIYNYKILSPIFIILELLRR